MSITVADITFTTRNNKIIAARHWINTSSTEERRVAICLHGWLDNASTFDLVAPILLDDSTHNLDSIISLDLAGHGQSGHNPTGIYHTGEHVADIADVLYDMGWFHDSRSKEICKSSRRRRQLFVIGHSMGGGIASVLCGTFPNQVDGLVMLEAMGPWSGNIQTTAINLRKSILQRRNRIGQSGRPPRLFPNVESAAIRRSEGNTVGLLPLEAARVLCRRGLEQAEVPLLSGDGEENKANKANKTTLPPAVAYVWSTDPNLLGPSRLKYSPAQVKTFCSSLTCPTLMVTVNDGILRRGKFLLFRTSSSVVSVGIICILRLILAMVAVLRWTRSWFTNIPSKIFMKAAFGLNWGLELRSKIDLMRRAAPSFVHAVLENGGHHPQLTRPMKVANEIIKFLNTVKRREKKEGEENLT
jgi:pimeloyl-ACP methyl ester carboxylesterase